MDRSTGRITRSAARRFQAFPKVYKEAFTGASIIVTPSATGKGIHMRWQYPESAPDDQGTIQTGHLSATNPLARELTLHVDDEYAHLFDGSLSSIDSDPSFQNLESDAISNAFASLLEGSLSSLSSISSDEGMDDATVMEHDDAEEPARVPRTITRIHQLPDRIIFRPDDFSEAAKFRRMMREEERIEETFHAQWQKMVEQRQIALRTIKRWMKKGKAKCGTPSDESTEDEGADHQMNVDDENHKTRNAIMCNPDDPTPMITRAPCSGPDRGPKGEHRDGAARRRQLGPCGTIIIENQCHGTSTPPPYPQDWISRRLAGRESTEILENALN
ncbi:hypothetical protein M378DRAFT_15678 [Amanita muscaria Koide BX008]|uniref:Uncharacterized protein n=1 Tax=Amanita muscaria (strain Koide BX008) TaxID=946122 RepID=A0A0C2WNF9_AMAMK|nr:hypothetical protein M378DRAFT_15678 [Amanita muscaria Koide BX008]